MSIAQLIEDLPWVPQGLFRSGAAIVSEAAIEKATKKPRQPGY